MKSKLSFVLAALLFTSLRAQGQGIIFVYDQQSADETTRREGGVPSIQAEQPLGQSFIPGLSSVGFIRLYLYDSTYQNDLSGTLLINLRSDTIAGPILSSTDPVMLPPGWGFGEPVNFYFSNPVAVNPGTTYFFQPVVQSGNSWGLNVANYDYADGTIFGNGLPSPFRDAWFREGIIIPEPSSALLVLIGGGALVGLRHLRKAQQTRRGA